MGIFDDLDNAPMPNSGGNYVAEGVYVVEIDRCKQGESGRGQGAYVVNEFTVLETLVAYPERKSWIDGSVLPPSARPGERVGQWIGFKHLSAQSNVKGFLVAATGLPPKLKMPDGTPITDAEGKPQTWKDIGGKVYSGDGTMLRGTKLLLRAFLIKTKEAKKPFTVHDWQPYSEENVAKLRELAAEHAKKTAAPAGAS